MSNVMISKSDFTITVNKVGGRIVSTGPMTVKNQIQEIRSLDDLAGVNTAQRVDGATLVYNATTGEYDVKPYNDDPLLNVGSLYVQKLYANNSVGTNGQVLYTNGNTIYWSNSVANIFAGNGLTGGGQGANVALSVNATYFATFITANNANYAYGKPESDLQVNFALLSGNANFAYVANNATYAYGKQESDLQVNFALLSGNANFAYVAALANNATYAYGKPEADLQVNFALLSGNANFAYTANNADLLDGLDSTYFTNATNISTGTLNSLRLPTTGVITGTYGNASSIPVITVDQYGRLTSVSTSAVAGVTSYQYNSSNNTFSIATGDGSVFTATISTVSDFTITGNLTVSGTTTTVNTQNITVKDPVIRLNDGQLTPFNDIGIVMQRYAVANSTNYNVVFAWDEDSKQLKIGKSPEDGNDAELSFSEEWARFDELGNLYTLGNVESSNNIKVTNTLVINSVAITELLYPGTANNATYAFGKTENTLNVNSAVYATNSQFAVVANTATYFNGIIDEGEY